MKRRSQKFFFNLPSEIYRKLKKISASNSVTMTQIVVVAISNYIAAYEAKNGVVRVGRNAAHSKPEDLI